MDGSKNKNCLEGWRCPLCGNEDSFKVDAVVHQTVFLTDDGTEDTKSGGDTTWEDHSPAECSECGHYATVGFFQLNKKHDLTEDLFRSYLAAPNRCPFCCDEDILENAAEYEGNFYQPVTCKKCGRQWDNIYVLSDIGWYAPNQQAENRTFIKAADLFENKLKPTSMTANQMILLLDIYRGTYDPNRYMAGLQDDAKYLIQQDLIKWKENTQTTYQEPCLEITTYGNQFVQHILKGRNNGTQT